MGEGLFQVPALSLHRPSVCQSRAERANATGPQQAARK